MWFPDHASPRKGEAGLLRASLPETGFQADVTGWGRAHPERQPVTQAPGPDGAAPGGLPGYDASSIHVLGDAEIPERFLFAKVAELERSYPHVSPPSSAG